jgi:hypothetical protein
MTYMRISMISILYLRRLPNHPAGRGAFFFCVSGAGAEQGARGRLDRDSRAARRGNDVGRKRKGRMLEGRWKGVEGKAVGRN